MWAPSASTAPSGGGSSLRPRERPTAQPAMREPLDLTGNADFPALLGASEAQPEWNAAAAWPGAWQKPEWVTEVVALLAAARPEVNTGGWGFDFEGLSRIRRRDLDRVRQIGDSNLREDLDRWLKLARRLSRRGRGATVPPVPRLAVVRRRRRERRPARRRSSRGSPGRSSGGDEPHPEPVARVAVAG